MHKRFGRARQVALVLIVFSFSVWVGMAQAQQLPTVEAKDFAKDDFAFPEDIAGPGVHVLFLGMAVDQDNGAAQGEALLVWFKALSEADVIPELALPWHFSVIEGVPFFVKGFVRRGIAKTYGGLLPSRQGVVMFVDDVSAFASAAGLALDGQPRLLLYTRERGIMEVFVGDYTPAGGAAVAAALAELRSELAAPTQPAAALLSR